MPQSTIVMVMFLMIFGMYAGRKKRGTWSRWLTPACVVGLGLAGIALGYENNDGFGVSMAAGVVFVGAGIWLAIQEARKGIRRA